MAYHGGVPLLSGHQANESRIVAGYQELLDSKLYTPTPNSRSTRPDEITSVAWNQQVQYVLAGSSSTGYTIVWDVRGKREVLALAYGRGAGTFVEQIAVGGGLAVGGRRGMSDIGWYPDNATRLVTASEDDPSSVIIVWDLHNARAPEKILTGHDEGVLSLSWCKQDADLLLSCLKDNRALCWNPQTSEITGELPSHDNWAFQVDWCPRDPDLATTFFDGTIGIHTIQSTNESSTAAGRPAAPKADGSDVFDAPGFSQASHSGKNPVHIHLIATEQDLVKRANKLQGAIEKESLQSFAEEKTTDSTTTIEGWKALLSLFNANSRDELVTLLSSSKYEVAAHVGEAIKNLKLTKSFPRRVGD
ncbi:Protein transport protein SEC31 [Leucoagaricus sp. SymC.cos]|nr:Protein transport protein SEC31 [Leucoagaricus sp. SymC.cos]